jgi:hypothetical protein
MGDERRERLGRGSRIAALFGIIASISVVGFAFVPGAIAAGVCETEVVHNYLKPIERLPAMPAIPADNALPFGPRDLFVSRMEQSRLIRPGSGELGFKVTFGKDAGRGRSSPHLDWLITAELLRVSRKGAAKETLGWKRKHITSVGPHGGVSFRLPVPNKLGLYRLEIVFRNGGGKRLGRFGEYVRVLRPAGPNGRLTLNKTSFLPGETVSVRAEEHGIGWIEVNDVYSVDTYEDSTWARAPISPKEQSLLIGTLIGPGEATSMLSFNPEAPCWSFTIPPSAPPGLYRLVVDGASMTFAENHLMRGSPLTLSSEFQVRPSF